MGLSIVDTFSYAVAMRQGIFFVFLWPINSLQIWKMKS